MNALTKIMLKKCAYFKILYCILILGKQTKAEGCALAVF